MPATVTLVTTTLAETLDAGSDRVRLASTAGVLVGMRLYADGELMTVRALLPDPWVLVLRGQGSTRTQPHASALTVYIGRGDQFYDKDPVGRPPEAIEVSPWINLRNGNVWFAQGDTDPTGRADRWWQLARTTYDQGPLGVRVKTQDPTAST